MIDDDNDPAPAPNPLRNAKVAKARPIRKEPPPVTPRMKTKAEYDAEWEAFVKRVKEGYQE